MRVFALFVLGIAALAPAGAQVRPRRAAPPPRVIRDLDRFERMSPEERKRELAKLPPARRRQIEERLGRLNNLPPDQRDQLRDRFQRFQRLSPERRAAVREELLRLRGMAPAERRRRLQEIRGRFSPEERDILEEVSVRPPVL